MSDYLILGVAAGACEQCFEFVGFSEEVSVFLAVFLTVVVRSIVSYFDDCKCNDK